MREILFRGKRIDNGEWAYGFCFCMHHDDDREHLHHFIIPLNVPIPKDKTIGEIQVEVDPETIGQYTGLADKNGKKIFEGDIVRFYGGESCQGYWEHDKTMVIDSLLNHECVFWLCESENVEVLGNIHDELLDNSELLEDKL